MSYNAKRYEKEKGASLILTGEDFEKARRFAAYLYNKPVEKVGYVQMRTAVRVAIDCALDNTSSISKLLSERLSVALDGFDWEDCKMLASVGLEDIALSCGLTDMNGVGDVKELAERLAVSLALMQATLRNYEHTND